jgi:hypothetical protein
MPQSLTETTEFPGDVLEESNPGPELSNEAAFEKEIEMLLRDSVLDTDSLAIRAFALSGGRNLLAFMLKETGDSFLVAFPAVLVGNTKGEVSTELATTVPVVRLYKSSIILSYIPKPLHILYYLTGILEDLDSYPGYFNERRLNNAVKLATLLKDTLGSTKDEDFEKIANTVKNRIAENKEDNYDDSGPVENIMYTPQPSNKRWRH